MNMYAKDSTPITLEEFDAMEKDECLNYELIDGIVMMSPRPGKTHQRILLNLSIAFRRTLDNGCTVYPEIELLLDDNILVPDISILCNDDTPKATRHQKPPLIVIEIVSPSSSSRDHITKRYKYESLGIKEYWIVSPEEKCVTVLYFAANTHEMYCSGQVKSVIMPEIQIDTTEIFAE